MPNQKSLRASTDFHVHWIATGGTIAGSGAAGQTAGYKAGQLTSEEMLAFSPTLREQAHWSFEQPYNIASQHITLTHWAMLIRAVMAALDDPAVDAILITHGTDTLEETAFLLHLLIPALSVSNTKPLVLTAAMRPATALSADGPGNISDSLAWARYVKQAPHANAMNGQRVWVVMQNRVMQPVGLFKRHATGTDAFSGNPTVATVLDQRVLLSTLPASSERHAWAAGRFNTLSERIANGTAVWPDVVLSYLYADMDAARFKQMLTPAPDGLVLATLGHGSIPDYLRDKLEDLLDLQIPIIKTSRTVQGPVFQTVNTTHSPKDAVEQGIMLAGGMLTPPQARLALQCCLMAGESWPAM